MTERLTIRDLKSHDDYAACVALQRETWGQGFNDTVPASILLVSQKLGGVAAGAFDPSGTLLGFVYGMTGVENGRIVHWSDMLAVRPEAQNAGIGRRLKEYQREAVAAVGADVIYWTFDPLVARNAYLNFTVFGVRAVEYVRDMYGASTGSELHRLGTDRLIVAWPVRDAELRKRRNEIANAQRSNPVTQALVEIPPDITELMRSDPERAARWRASSRSGLEKAFHSGFRLDGVRLAAGRVHYVLTKPPELEPQAVEPQAVEPQAPAPPMIQLDRIVLREIRLRLKEPFRISSGIVDERRILLLELFDASGASEWAECVAGEHPNYSPETIDTAWLAIRHWLAPRLLGKTIGAAEAVHDMLERNVCGHNMAKAALEMGCWGIDARMRQTSLSKRIGGERERVATGISIGIQKDPAALVARAQRALADGYRKIKVKIQPGADVDYVRAVREALPGGTHLMADANSAFTLADADRLAELDAFQLIMIEQPLHRDDLVRHAQLQQRLRTPICLDESITDVARCEDMIALGSGRIVNIKPGRVGGFAVARRIHDICASAGIPVWCGGMLESGIGRAYNVALASLPNFSLPGDLSPSARYWERDVVTPEWTMDNEGMVSVPRTQPGIGVQVDRERVDALTMRTEELRP